MLWEGYELETGFYQGYEYGIVFPKERMPGSPYLWRTEFFGAFPSVDLAMLQEGYAVAYYRISDLYGSPRAVALMEAFQPFLQEKYKLCAQAVLLGFSRGGLYALHYAAKHPERVAALYLDAPVVDIYSWPGGFLSGKGAAPEWEECKSLWNKTHEEFLNTVNVALDTLLAWSVPLILVAGAKDEDVPYKENGAILQAAYEKGRGTFQAIIKPECAHHPHSLSDPSPVVEFLRKNRAYPTIGNALRINDQSLSRYPLTLMVHDAGHLELVMQAEAAFQGKYPFGYIGTSPWLGSVTNQKTMDDTDAQNVMLYDYVRAQMEIGFVVYAREMPPGKLYGMEGEEEGQEEQDILHIIKDMEEKCPEAKQIWLCGKEEVPLSWKEKLGKYGVSIKACGTAQEYTEWLAALGKEIEQQKPPVRVDCLDREWAEWTNLSITMPAEEKENRILLVGDSISAGYGDMVQKRMPGWHVDRLNTSEGIHHPNFIRLLKIALQRYPYRMLHINNGIHLHGQSTEEYGHRLEELFSWLQKALPSEEYAQTKIMFATTTPISRTLAKEELDGFDAHHFSMGGKAPLAKNVEEKYWVTDKEASRIYLKLNQKAKEICACCRIPVNDLYQLCVTENLQKSDGVHFTKEAYGRLADEVAKMLRYELGSPQRA